MDPIWLAKCAVWVAFNGAVLVALCKSQRR